MVAVNDSLVSRIEGPKFTEEEFDSLIGLFTLCACMFQNLKAVYAASWT